jgi:hypothetical protein
MHDILYEVAEETKVHHVGFLTNDSRYDFSIIYTTHFYGKTMISCLQSGITVLVDKFDLTNVDYIQQTFKLKNLAEAKEVCSFLTGQVPSLLAFEQY